MTDNSCWLRQSCKRPDCPEFCMKLFRVTKLYDNGLISEHQRKHIDFKVDSDGTDREAFIELQKIQQNIEEFVKEGKNLYLHSKTFGCGKTSWCLRLIEVYIDKIWHKADLTTKVLFVHVPKFMIALKESITTPSPYVDHIKKNYLDADIVVFDEIGSKVATAFEQEQLLNMINSRLDQGKCCFYTSNLDDNELSDSIGGRLASRIIGLSTDIVLRGKDKRWLVK